MPNQRFLKNFDLARITLDEYRHPLLLQGNEAQALVNFVPDKGALIPRPATDRLVLGDIDGYCTQGLYSARLGTNAQWLIAAIGDASTHQTTMVAIATDFSQSSASVVRRTITSSQSLAFGRRWSFFTYRGKVFASNGEESFVFDGDKWTGPNNTGTDAWRRCGLELAWGSAQEFYGRAVLCNTPHYPNEITWAQVYDDVDTTTKWSGYTQIGGAGTSANLYGITAPVLSGDTLFIAGDNGTGLISKDSGFSWSRVAIPPTHVTLFSVAANNTNIMICGNTWGAENYVAQSADGGTTWQRTTGLPLIWGYSAAMNGDTRVVAGGYAGNNYNEPAIAISYDNGSTWYSAPLQAGSLTKMYDLRAIAVTTETGPSLFRSVAVGLRKVEENSIPLYWDGTQYAMSADTGLAKDLYGVTHLSGSGPTARFLAVGETATILDSTDAGANWASVSGPVGVTDNLRAVTAYSAVDAVAVGDSGTVIVGHYDTGTSSWTWTDKSISTATTLNGVNAATGLTGLRRIVVVGDAGYAAFSDDGGTTWTSGADSADEANRFGEAYYLGGEEEIRCTYKANGLLYVFTDRNAYVFDQQFAQRSVTNGIEVFNDRCVAEYGGKFWLLGKYNDVVGLYAWDGVNQPVLMSRPFQTLLDGITLDAAPRSIIFKADTKSEFTPPTAGTGIWWSSNYFTNKNGVLVLHKGQTGTIYSHADTAGTPAPYGGYYVPDMNNTSANTNLASFGTLGLEMALNETALATPNVYCKVYARVAASETIGGIVRANNSTWTTDWQLLTEGNNSGTTPDDSLPYGGQGSTFSRYNLHIDHTKFAGYSSANEPYQWIQFKIEGGNATDADSNWQLNRVILRPQVRLLSDASVAVPNLAVWDDKLWVSLGALSTINDLDINGIVVANGGSAMAETKHEAITSTTAHGGRMIFGLTIGSGAKPQIFYTQTESDDTSGFTSRIDTGRINLSEVDPRYAHIRKKLKRIFVVAKPNNKELARVSISWWPDGRKSLIQTKTMDFNDQHAPIYNTPASPAAPEYQYREIEVSSPYQTLSDGSPQYASVYGHDFTIRVQTLNPSYVNLYQLAVEFEMATPDVKESDGAAEL